jgi:hypothetical protein
MLVEKKVIDVPIESASGRFGFALQSEIIELIKAVFARMIGCKATPAELVCSMFFFCVSK